MSESDDGNLSVVYVSGNQGMLDDVKELWEELNSMLLQCSVNFKPHFGTMTFEKRKLALLKKTEHGEIHVDVAVNQLGNQKVGYCISTINEQKEGEIESIFVEKGYRGLRIGDALMRKAVAWMDSKDVEKKLVSVSVGNEQVFGFYGRYSFCPRRTMLEQTKNL
jgi:diamine N-acetyltransferase